jgi:hypothetical protein
VSADDGRHLLAVLSAAYEAAARGVEMVLDHDPRAYAAPPGGRSLLSGRPPDDAGASDRDAG